MEFGIPIVFLLFLVFVILLINNYRRSRASGLGATAGVKEFGDSWEDSWEGAFWEAQNPQAVTANLIINYTDGAGFVSERAIRVCEFDNELYGGILIAHCQLRDAMRTFRFSRIMQCKEVGSEQTIDDIAAYLNELSKQQIKSAEQATDLSNS